MGRDLSVDLDLDLPGVDLSGPTMAGAAAVAESTTVVGLVPSLACALTLKPTSSLGGVDLLTLLELSLELLPWLAAGSSNELWEKWHLSPRRHPLDEKWNRHALLTLASLGR